MFCPMKVINMISYFPPVLLIPKCTQKIGGLRSTSVVKITFCRSSETAIRGFL